MHYKNLNGHIRFLFRVVQRTDEKDVRSDWEVAGLEGRAGQSQVQGREGARIVQRVRVSRDLAPIALSRGGPGEADGLPFEDLKESANDGDRTHPIQRKVRE